jgi:hypothetical protein
VRFFVMIGVAAFIVCGVTAFCTHRAAHGRIAEERAAYAIGEKVGEQAPPGATLPTDAELNMMAQKYFKQQGIGDQLRSSREQPSCRLGIRPSKTVTPTGSSKRIPGNDPATCAASETFPVDFLLDRSLPHCSLRVCAGGIGDSMRLDSEYARLQSGRGFAAPMHHRRPRLWSASLYAWRARLADACYYSRWLIRIRDLADRSHPASRKLAKAIRSRFPIFNGLSAPLCYRKRWEMKLIAF